MKSITPANTHKGRNAEIRIKLITYMNNNGNKTVIVCEYDYFFSNISRRSWDNTGDAL